MPSYERRMPRLDRAPCRAASIISRGYAWASCHAFSRLASGDDGHTARSLAPSRQVAIYSALGIESGTVDDSAVSRSSVRKSCLLAAAETGLAPSLLKAAYMAVWTADSISEIGRAACRGRV